MRDGRQPRSVDASDSPDTSFARFGLGWGLVGLGFVELTPILQCSCARGRGGMPVTEDTDAEFARQDAVIAQQALLRQQQQQQQHLVGEDSDVYEL